MHEMERDAALALLDDAQVQGRVIVGEISEDQLSTLSATGVFIIAMNEEPPESHGNDVPGNVRTEHGLLGDGAAQRGAELSSTPAEVDIWVVRLAGPLLDEWRNLLEQSGVELIERLRGDSYSARIQLPEVAVVRSLHFVVDVRLYETPRAVVDATLSHRRGSAGTAQPILFELLVHRTGDLDRVREWLEARNLEVTGSARRKLRFLARPGAAVLTDLAMLPDVALVEEFKPPRFSNDHACRILGLERTISDDSPLVKLRGQGQLVAVADSGIDEAHPDLQSRLADVRAWGRPGDSSDLHGHGTHVAGSVAGDGTKSNGAIRGAAPEARLFFQSIMDSKGGLSGLPTDLSELFEEAYQEGARIHNNSWGSEAGSAYRVPSLEVDDFVARHPDMLVVIAAGNDGTAFEPQFTDPGYVDLFSIAAPATAKNALTVGASRSDRAISDCPTWGQWSEGEIPPPLGTELVCGDPEAMAAFSSRGPCDEQIRIKPDVVAPGTFILSTRSSLAPSENFWAEADADTEASYAYMGGTSMAAPLVSGCAALVRQYYTETRGHQPSAALLKATLVNGTHWLTGEDAIHDHPTEPNYHQGFGCVYLPWSIPNPSEPAMRLEFADNWKEPSTSFLRTGDVRRFVVRVTEATWLRLCLTWTDPPGRSLQNNLNLFMEHSESGTKWTGNENRSGQFRMVGDTGNNVQVIRLDQPAPGTYLIEVAAWNLLHRGQSFSLVVVGGLASTLAED